GGAARDLAASNGFCQCRLRDRVGSKVGMTSRGLVTVRPAVLDDAPAIAAIYAPFIESSVVTFEEAAVGPEAMAARMTEVAARFAWLVACEGNQVVGYAYGAPWRTRSAFAHTVETSIYLRQNAQGKGTGRRLYSALLEALRTRGFRVAIGAIALPNVPSQALHAALGFDCVGLHAGVGYKFGRHVDLEFWQCSLST
ncbi:MAG: GNAT family N-acetyltransferase, partial [Pseudomonadales bacterium]